LNGTIDLEGDGTTKAMTTHLSLQEEAIDLEGDGTTKAMTTHLSLHEGRWKDWRRNPSKSR
jgi:hypothetical protein